MTRDRLVGGPERRRPGQRPQIRCRCGGQIKSRTMQARFGTDGTLYLRKSPAGPFRRIAVTDPEYARIAPALRKALQESTDRETTMTSLRHNRQPKVEQPADSLSALLNHRLN